MPRYYEIVADLPHTPTGRIAKHRLSRDRTPAEVDVEVETAVDEGRPDR